MVRNSGQATSVQDTTGFSGRKCTALRAEVNPDFHRHKRVGADRRMEDPREERGRAPGTDPGPAPG